MIGDDQQQLDVKKLDQVMTVKPYDYVIIGSYSKNGKNRPAGYINLLKCYQNDLAKKKVGVFSYCGDYDETMVLKVPAGTPHLIAGGTICLKSRKTFPMSSPSSSPGSADAR